MPTNGDDRKTTIAECLIEAERCRQLAERSSGEQRKHWLELAESWSALAAAIKQGSS
jgi:hypothetical protein